MKKYETPEAEIVSVTACDVITTSIFEDGGENDGEWTGFKSNGTKSIGIWN